MNWREVLSLASDFSGVAALLITIAGFGVTIFQVVRARRASQAAAEAADSALRKVSSRLFQDTVANALILLGELKDACRTERWELAIDRCENLSHALVSIISDQNLDQKDLDNIPFAIDDLKLILDRLEESGRRINGPIPKKMSSTLHDMSFWLQGLDTKLRGKALEV